MAIEGQRLLEQIIVQRDTHLQNLRSTAFQLANYYFVFQGVILTIFFSSSLKCSHRWLIFTVSIIAAMLNLVALLVILLEYAEKLEGHDTNIAENNQQQAQESQNQTKGAQQGTGVAWLTSKLPIDDPVTKIQRYFVLASCMILLSGFAAVTLTSIWLFPCTHDDNVVDKCVNICDNANCIRVCAKN